ERLTLRHARKRSLVILSRQTNPKGRLSARALRLGGAAYEVLVKSHDLVVLDGNGGESRLKGDRPIVGDHAQLILQNGSPFVAIHA
ncbi:MAG: hypothetical protein ACYDD7_23925, partial [Acidimicrobiales bacterium]